MAEIAFDLGQTQTRLRLIRDSGAASAVELEGFRYGSSLTDTIAARCIEAAETLGNYRVTMVAGGVTGLYGRAPDLSKLLETLSASIGTRRVIIADDAVTSHLGALAGESGTLVAAGTGLVGLGIGPSGAARVDGVGFLIGDNGAGWWIGREGIIAALSRADGRSGGSAALLDRLEQQFGPVGDVPAKIASSPFPVGMVASFAPAVATAARRGDMRSREIWTEAGRHIADAIVAASTRAGFTRDAAFSWAVTGRLTGASDLLDPVLNSIVRAHFPEGTRVTPSGTSLDGAQGLLRHPNPMALAPLVGVCATDKETDD